MHGRCAEGDPGAARCFNRRVAGADQIGGEMFEVIGELSFHLRFELVALNNGAKPRMRLERMRAKSERMLITMDPRLPVPMRVH